MHGIVRIDTCVWLCVNCVCAYVYYVCTCPCTVLCMCLCMCMCLCRMQSEYRTFFIIIIYLLKCIKVLVMCVFISYSQVCVCFIVKKERLHSFDVWRNLGRQNGLNEGMTVSE